MENQGKIIHEEMQKLIAKSCEFQNTECHKQFQKALLKFFFNATDVTLDYEDRAIFLWTSSVSADLLPKLYHLNEAVSVKISYSSLEEILKGCLESGEKQERFYKTMLFHYNHVAESLGVEVLSA